MKEYAIISIFIIGVLTICYFSSKFILLMIRTLFEKEEKSMKLGELFLDKFHDQILDMLKSYVRHGDKFSSIKELINDVIPSVSINEKTYKYFNIIDDEGISLLLHGTIMQILIEHDILDCIIENNSPDTDEVESKILPYNEDVLSRFEYKVKPNDVISELSKLDVSDKHKEDGAMSQMIGAIDTFYSEGE